MTLGAAAARFLSQSPTRNAILGAGVGAAAGGMQENGSAWRGALTGAAIGGGIGAVGRAGWDTRLLHAVDNPSAAPLTAMQTVTGTARRAGQGLLNFGKRQVHAATGAFDHDAIGMAGNRASADKIKLLNARQAQELGTITNPEYRAAAEKAFADNISAERIAGQKAQSLADAGVTTLPGIAKALATKGRRAEAFRGMARGVADGPLGAAAAIGLPTLIHGHDIMKGDESAQGGLTSGQKWRRAIVGTAANVATSGMPVITGTAASMGLEHLGTYGLRRRAPLDTTAQLAMRHAGPASERPA